MTDRDRMIWAATFAAAYVAEVRGLKRGDVELNSDIAGRAAGVATEALKALGESYWASGDKAGEMFTETQAAYKEFQEGAP